MKSRYSIFSIARNAINYHKDWERAWRSPDVFDRFLRELPAHLNERGRALVVLSSDNEVEEALHAAKYLQINVFKRQDLINEVVTVYEVVVGARHASPLQAT